MTTRDPNANRLTVAQLDHLSFALGELRRSGTYFGPYEQFVKRHKRIEEWVKKQLDKEPV